MLVIKTWAWWMTRSSAILSDAAESVVHVAAVGFVVYSLRLSQKPPDESHPYGHAKISFFSSFPAATLASMIFSYAYTALRPASARYFVPAGESRVRS